MTELPPSSPIVLPINTAFMRLHSSLFPSSLLAHVIYSPRHAVPLFIPRKPIHIFEPGLSPWSNSQCQEPPFFFHPPPHVHEPVHVVVTPPPSSQEPASSNSGSYKHSPALTTPGSGSPEPNQNTSKNSSIDERKHRRMLSNRESARRSRMRKQKHLDNLRNQANRLKVSNRQTMNRLSIVVQQNQLVSRENEYLRSESAMLRQRLWDIRQVLLVRQLQQNLNPSAWPCNNFTSINGGPLQQHSLIT